jgi:hypothetical protein
VRSMEVPHGLQSTALRAHAGHASVRRCAIGRVGPSGREREPRTLQAQNIRQLNAVHAPLISRMGDCRSRVWIPNAAL